MEDIDLRDELVRFYREVKFNVLGARPDCPCKVCQRLVGFFNDLLIRLELPAFDELKVPLPPIQQIAQPIVQSIEQAPAAVMQPVAQSQPQPMNKSSSLKEDAVLGYCVRCRAKQGLVNARHEDVQTSRGLKHFIKGTCAVCGTKVCVTAKKDT